MHTPAANYSHVARVGNTLYLSGQVPVGQNGSVVDGGIEPQTRQVLENVKAALALAGAGMEHVVKTTVFLEDARDFGGMNKVYAAYFAKEPPARSTLECRLMIDIKVEIEAVAYAPLIKG